MLGGVRNCAQALRFSGQAGVPVPLRLWRWLECAKVACHRIEWTGIAIQEKAPLHRHAALPQSDAGPGG